MKKKPFFQPIFTESLIAHFLSVFIEVLIQKSHDLLNEEITLAIFHMASVDFNAFFKQFLLDFLNKSKGLDPNQRIQLHSGFKDDVVSKMIRIFFFFFQFFLKYFFLLQDLPSFTINLQRFISDLRYYKICNASLPAGSVSFNM